MKIVLSIIGCTLMFVGCSMKEPDVALDMNISQNFLGMPDTSKVIQDGWWKNFGSRELDTLVQKALQNSPDILVAYEKIEQSKIALHSAGALYLPSVDAKVSSSASQSKKNNAAWNSSDATSASLGVSYEFDVWGKIAANIKASKASLDMTLYDYEAVRLSLIANVAESYFGFLATKARLELALESLKISKDILVILESKFALGVVSEIDLSTQRSAILNQENAVALLKKQLNALKYALGTLVGENPDFFEDFEVSIYDIALAEVGAGMPSELLLRRPDIAAQKAALESNKALIQIADAARYPSFSLSASGGVSSNELLSLSNPTSVLSLGLGMGYNLFDGGRLKNQVLIEESKAKATLQRYRKTVLNAFQEVEEALNDLTYTKIQYANLEKLVEEARFALQLSDSRHKFGAADFETLLGSQRSYLTLKQQSVSALEMKLNALIKLHKVLGGGWKMQK